MQPRVNSLSREITVLSRGTYTLFRPAPGRRLPTVIHLPGFGEDSLSHSAFGIRLAIQGFQCASLMPPWVETPDLNNPNPALLFKLLEAADHLLADVVGSLEMDPDTEPGWLAITGFSMGGMFVARTLAREEAHPFDAAAMILATGDWSFIPRAAMNAFPELAALVPADALPLIEETLRAQSPVAVPYRFPPTPLLLINTTLDPRVPQQVASRFATILRSAYEKVGVGEALTVEMREVGGHQFRRDMQLEVCQWLAGQWQQRETRSARSKGPPGEPL